MKNNIKTNYNHTIYASYFGYITQAIVNNFVPLLFLTLQRSYQISLEQIGFLVTLNFGVQLLVDFLAVKFVDKIGYRISIVAAHLLAAGGLVGLGVFPELLPSPYLGIMLAVILYACGGGLIEVLISPIVEACPTEKKDQAMSLLHSFYCWGHVGVIIISTVFFGLVGIDNWKMLACIWAVIPFFNCFYFAQVPIEVLVEQGKQMSLKTLAKNRLFWIFIVLMVCAGASEQGMSQWASAFAESGLGVSKTLGDLAGPCTFAILMGISRLFYGKFGEKIRLRKFMAVSACFCILSYLLASLTANPVLGLIGCGMCGLSVGIMWPGTFSLAAGAMKMGGTAMFAMFALAGDLGCAVGPGLVGTISEFAGGNLKAGILSGVIFPVLLLGGLLLLLLQRRSKGTLA